MEENLVAKLKIIEKKKDSHVECDEKKEDRYITQDGFDNARSSYIVKTLEYSKKYLIRYEKWHISRYAFNCTVTENEIMGLVFVCFSFREVPNAIEFVVFSKYSKGTSLLFINFMPRLKLVCITFHIIAPLPKEPIPIQQEGIGV